MIDSFGMSHVGLVRSNNEDRYVAEPKLGLFAVADGMGGAHGGELASRLAVETLVSEIGAQPSWTPLISHKNYAPSPYNHRHSQCLGAESVGAAPTD